jgi:hypothetical protein
VHLKYSFVASMSPRAQNAEARMPFGCVRSTRFQRQSMSRPASCATRCVPASSSSCLLTTIAPYRAGARVGRLRVRACGCVSGSGQGRKWGAARLRGR